ncbi:MAG: response regulator [Candidatus Anammoxibacter sp.]
MENKIEILLVEDSPTQAIEVQHFLEGYHYTVSVAQTGKKALDFLKTSKPSVIISDIVMPEMDGYELCRLIKDNNATNDIPIVLLTTLSDPGDIIHGLAAGAEDYILKPFDKKDLLNKIEQVLSNPVKKDEILCHEGLEISFGGNKHTITASRKQILHLLIATYANIIHQKSEVVVAHGELEGLNKELEKRLKELEESKDDLEISEERFRILVQMIPDVVYRIDKKGRFTFINNAVQQLGYLPSELIGKHFSCIMSEDDAKKVSRDAVLREYAKKQGGADAEVQPKLFDERRTGERVTKNLEIKLVPKTGKHTIAGIIGPVGDEIVIVEISSSGLFEKEKMEKARKFAGTVGVVRDITERKLAERAISYLNKELEEKVRERTKALYKSKKDIEKAMEELNVCQQQTIQAEKLSSLGTVIAGVAHELNNPLMGIINYVQYASTFVKDEEPLKYLKKAEQQAKRASKIINNLLSYSRPARDDCISINCKDVVKNATELLDSDFRSNNIKVTINIPETLPSVCAKHDSLQQVFLNLLINARDAMANSSKKEIYIEGSQKENRVQITLQDSGCGIAKESINKIFDPFFSTKEPGKGTGLGLSVSYNIITGFDGTLICENIREQGAKFIITLPVEDKSDSGI